MNRNIILAGVARSGSTLACYLLNKTPDVVALLEPIAPAEFTSLSDEEAVAFVENFFEKQRASLLEKGIARSQSRQGKVPDNLMGGLDAESGKRKMILDGNEVLVDKPLSSDFSLVVKQPGMFTGKLYLLNRYFNCYATIRNPFAVLRSWNTVDMAVTNGHAPAAEQCDPVLENALKNEADVFQRQLILLSWYFEQFYNNLSDKKIIRYEDVIDSGGKSLSCVVSSAISLQEPLNSKNNNKLYDDSIKKKLMERLLDSEGYYWKYYSKDDVTSLL